MFLFHYFEIKCLLRSNSIITHIMNYTGNKEGDFVANFNILRPIYNDAICRHQSASTFARVMACCLTVPIHHYLSQCWHIKGVLWHSPESNFTRKKIKNNGVVAISVLNYANPVYGVAIICHQVRWLCWGHPSFFHIATSLLIWYKMFCVRDISYRLIWKFSVYAQSGKHSRFNW